MSYDVLHVTLLSLQVIEKKGSVFCNFGNFSIGYLGLDFIGMFIVLYFLTYDHVRFLIYIILLVTFNPVSISDRYPPFYTQALNVQNIVPDISVWIDLWLNLSSSKSLTCRKLILFFTFFHLFTLKSCNNHVLIKNKTIIIWHSQI